MTQEVKPCPWCGKAPDISNDASFRLTDGIKYGALQCCIIGPEVRTDYKELAHWRDKAIAAWNDRKGEASIEPNPQYAAYVSKCQAGGILPCSLETFMVEHTRLIREVVNGAAAGDALDAATRAALSDALNTTLWLYRRLPHAYNKPPFVDRAILVMAEHLGMEHVPECIRERTAISTSTSKEE